MKGHRKPGPVLMPVRVYLFVGDSKKKVELPPSQGGDGRLLVYFGQFGCIFAEESVTRFISNVLDNKKYL